MMLPKIFQMISMYCFCFVKKTTLKLQICDLFYYASADSKNWLKSEAERNKNIILVDAKYSRKAVPTVRFEVEIEITNWITFQSSILESWGRSRYFFVVTQFVSGWSRFSPWLRSTHIIKYCPNISHFPRHVSFSPLYFLFQQCFLYFLFFKTSFSTQYYKQFSFISRTSLFLSDHMGQFYQSVLTSSAGTKFLLRALNWNSLWRGIELWRVKRFRLTIWMATFTKMCRWNYSTCFEGK